MASRTRRRFIRPCFLGALGYLAGLVGTTWLVALASEGELAWLLLGLPPAIGGALGVLGLTRQVRPVPADGLVIMVPIGALILFVAFFAGTSAAAHGSPIGMVQALLTTIIPLLVGTVTSVLGAAARSRLWTQPAIVGGNAYTTSSGGA